MSAKDDILAAIRDRRVRTVPRPALYRAPAPAADMVAQFAERAAAAHAEVRVLESAAEIAAAVADILRGKNLPATIHVPPGSALDAYTGTLSVESGPPGPEDVALAEAPLGIAETGTLVYAARADAPASWHFRAGLEIAVLHARDIVPHMENAVAKLKQRGALANTINLVTGPSRTGDIEQTLELGAHGPKAQVVLIIKGAP